MGFSKMKTDFLVGYKQERQDETDRRTKLVPKPRHMGHAVWNTTSRTTIVQTLPQHHEYFVATDTWPPQSWPELPCISHTRLARLRPPKNPPRFASPEIHPVFNPRKSTKFPFPENPLDICLGCPKNTPPISRGSSLHYTDTLRQAAPLDLFSV